jgi:geranylgeranyl diphosphate synthase type II
MGVPTEIRGRLEDWRRQIEDALDRCLPPTAIPPQNLHEAMRYAVFPGGKRLRPVLTLAAADAIGGNAHDALPGACAVELIHNYSLVHDDLPAMDDDDLRRGRPTLHRVFGEALAILAGDALLTCAFDTLVSASGGDPNQRLQAAATLARAAGAAGMVGGQVDDLQATGRVLERSHVESIHHRKTAALMGACARIGALLGGGGSNQVDLLDRFGERLGLAFQIIDDLLDLEGSEPVVGKTLRKDERAGKLTFPSVWGVEASRSRASELVQEAKSEIETLGARASILRSIADSVVERSR